MSRWWRAYDEAVDDPKLCLLTDKQHRAWFNLCCITSQNGGKLPAMAAVAFKLRMSVEKARAIVAELVALGLVDMDEEAGTTAPHNWGARQFQSDTSTERVKRFRKREGNVSSAVSETPPETEQIQSRTEDTADAASSIAPYAFESGVIRLRQKDFDQWKRAFSHLDLAAELLALTEWASQQGQKWFFAVSSALAKKNRDVHARIEQQKTAPAYRWNGIEGVT